jgi:hypothetical protein
MIKRLHWDDRGLSLVSQKYYAPYILPLLIERDTYMKLEDFTYFDQAVENCTVTELEQIS